MIVYDRDDLRYTAMTTPEGPATTMRNPLFLACLAALAMPGTALAQSAPLTLDRIFGDHAIATDHVEGGEWTADGSGYTAIEPSQEVKGGTDLVRYDVARNTRSVLVPARDLIVAATGKPIAIQGYAWSANGKRLLLFTNGTRFRRTRALGDYWLFDPATKQLRRIGGDAPPASLMYAEFSPDGSRIAYVRGNNLYVEPTAGDAPPRKLTQDGRANRGRSIRATASTTSSRSPIASASAWASTSSTRTAIARSSPPMRRATICRSTRPRRSTGQPAAAAAQAASPGNMLPSSPAEVEEACARSGTCLSLIRHCA